MIRTSTCAYQWVRNVSFSEDFAYLLNEWPHEILTGVMNMKHKKWENHCEENKHCQESKLRLWFEWAKFEIDLRIRLILVFVKIYQEMLTSTAILAMWMFLNYLIEKMLGRVATKGSKIQGSSLKGSYLGSNLFSDKGLSWK